MSHAASRRLLPLLAAAVLALVVGGGQALAASRAATPQRIVSMSASATDTLFAIGAGKQVVAVDSTSTYPKQAPLTKLSAFTPSAEAIAAYKPDLVIISDDIGKIAEQLEKLQITVLKSTAPTTLDDAYARITGIGAATGHAAQAARVVQTMKTKIAAIVKATARPAKPLSVYHELDQTLYSATSKTFIGQIYALLGMTNIADKAPGTSGYPQLSGEYIIASSPDLIVLADSLCCGQTPAKIAARPGWSTIAAVRNHAIVTIDDGVASQWGPRIVDFFRGLAAGVKSLQTQGK